MILETAQMLSTAYPVGLAPYKHTHVNHPCSLWARWSIKNFAWLLTHGIELCEEYTRRYGKVHKTEAVMRWFIDNPPDIPDRGLTQFVVAIKDRSHHRPDPVDSYRAYYLAEKVRFAKWAPRAKPPVWWPDQNA
jgi:hypothetical protein